MLVPVSWLKEYTDVKVDTQEFVDRMVISGSNLEVVEYWGEGIEGVVIGKIEKIEKHPDADKLSVCQINVGKSELVQIVTGAANIFEGAYVPVCLDGSHIPGPLHGQPKLEEGVTIHEGELRGVKSHGMLCSFTELGFPDKAAPMISKDGIWILEGEWTPGADLVEALELKEAVVDFEITPNRPDCLAMLGMARESSATFGEELRYPKTECEKVAKEKSADYIKVDVLKPELCKRYCCRVIKDIKIEQSPWWLQRRLILSGQRPINNIVDITNYVMLEYGQPLHAFDIRTIAGAHVIVDTAKDGEKFTTLDGTERTLTSSMLTIRDENGASAIAGVMGGMNSEIAADTNMVLVESANFLGDSVRRTSKDLKLRTEASGRFEKGIDPNLAKDACDRFCYLVEMLGAGTVLDGDVDVYPNVEQPVVTKIRVSRLNKVMGLELSADQMCKYLNALEIKTELDGDVITCTAPTVRQDLAIEEDYVEEVARMYGYDKLPVSIPKSSNTAKYLSTQEYRLKAKAVLKGLGVDEALTYSFVSPKALDKVLVPADSYRRQQVKILNPLGDETSVMRTMLLPNIMEVIYTNYSRSNENVKVYEIGNTFFDNKKGDNGALPEEKFAMCIACYGEKEDFYLMKGRLNEIFQAFGITDVDYRTQKENPSFHPGRCADIYAGDKFLGTLGQVHPDVCENYGVEIPVYAAEIEFSEIEKFAQLEQIFKPLPKFPAMTRDFAMVVTEDVKVGDLEKDIKNNAGDLLEDAKLFDVYRGSQMAAGTKSVAFSLVYRAPDRTLTDKEVNDINTKVLVSLKDKYNAVLREM